MRYSTSGEWLQDYQFHFFIWTEKILSRVIPNVSFIFRYNIRCNVAVERLCNLRLEVKSYVTDEFKSSTIAGNDETLRGRERTDNNIISYYRCLPTMAKEKYASFQQTTNNNNIHTYSHADVIETV